MCGAQQEERSHQTWRAVRAALPACYGWQDALAMHHGSQKLALNTCHGQYGRTANAYRPEWLVARAALTGHSAWQEHFSCHLLRLTKAKSLFWERQQSANFACFLQTQFPWS